MVTLLVLPLLLGCGPQLRAVGRELTPRYIGASGGVSLVPVRAIAPKNPLRQTHDIGYNVQALAFYEARYAPLGLRVGLGRQWLAAQDDAAVADLDSWMLGFDVIGTVPLRSFLVPYIFAGQNFARDSHRLVQAANGSYQTADGAASAGVHAGLGLWLGPAFFVEARALWQLGVAENDRGVSRAIIRIPVAVGVRCCAQPLRN